MVLIYGCSQNILFDRDHHCQTKDDDPYRCINGGCHYLEKEIRSQQELDEYVALHAKTGCSGVIELAGFDSTWEVGLKNGTVDVQRLPDEQEKARA